MAVATKLCLTASFRKFGVVLKEPRAKQAVLPLRFRTAYFVRGSLIAGDEWNRSRTGRLTPSRSPHRTDGAG